jgi:hypothetical protein
MIRMMQIDKSEFDRLVKTIATDAHQPTRHEDIPNFVEDKQVDDGDEVALGESDSFWESSRSWTVTHFGSKAISRSEITP